MALGDFTPTKLAEIQLKADQIWSEPQTQKNYTANGDTVKAIQSQQTAEITPLNMKSKKFDVSINWVDFCGDTATDVTDADACPVATPAEGEGKSEDYALDIFIHDAFSVVEEKFDDNIFNVDEVVAKGLLAKQKNILERFNAKALSVIDANKGVNPFLGIGSLGANANAGYTTIPSADMTIEKMYPYLVQVASMNRSNNAFVLDGGNLFQQYVLALSKFANADGKLDQNLLGYFDYVSDLFGFARNNVAGVSYLIDRGSIAIANRSKYPVVPREYGHEVAQTRYSTPLAQIPGLALDVIYTNKCVNDQITHIWDMKLRAGVFVNPTMCNAGNTGILGFKKV